MPAHRRSRLAAWRRFLLAVTLLATLLTMSPGARGQGTASAWTVLAQGTAWLTAAPYQWDTALEVVPVGDATEPSTPRSLGFVVGVTGTATLTTETPLGTALVWLDPGEAAFVGRDAGQARAATAAPATLLSITLAAASAGGSGPAAPFTPLAGLYELTLAQARLAPGEAITAPADEAPALLAVTGGTVTLTGGGAEQPLAAGDAATLTGPITIMATGPAPSTVLLARAALRPDQTPATGAADLGLWVWRCPPGLIAHPVMTDRGCEISTPLSAAVTVTIRSAAPESAALPGPVPGDAGAIVWPEVPFGEYIVTATLPPDAAGYALRPVLPGQIVAPLPDGTGYRVIVDGSQLDPRADYQRLNLNLFVLYP